MIFTTYFAKLSKLPKNVIPIAISAKVPAGISILRYPKLAPKYDMIIKWKTDHNDADYAQCYNAAILDKLDIFSVLDELQVMMPDEVKMQMQSPFWVNPDWHVALICYEKPVDFCHRHLVADWLTRNGIVCWEWKPDADNQ